MNLYEYKEVKTRKKHYCFLCNLEIPKQTKCVYEKGLYDGDFFSNYSHKECHQEWSELNEGSCDGDWCLLRDDMENFDEFKNMIKKKYKLGGEL